MKQTRPDSFKNSFNGSSHGAHSSSREPSSNLLSSIRERFGKTVVSGIIGLIAFVFIFFGVFSPKSTRGLHEGAVAATVNGEPISLSEFNREYNRRLEFFRNLGGGKISEEQLKMFRVRERVLDELVQRKVLMQEAERQGLLASDALIREKIEEIPAFQKDGKFNVVTYKQVLESNRYSPGGFERLMREDLSVQGWSQIFRTRATVTDAEAMTQYQLEGEKRSFKYVLLTTEMGRKAVKVSEDDVKKVISDPAKLNVLKAQFEAKKKAEYAGKTFESVQNELARNLVSSERFDEAQKVVTQLSNQVLPLLTADKTSDAKVNALLKAYGAEVKTVASLALQNPQGGAGLVIPGVGEVKDLAQDAFGPQGAALQSQAKKYTVASGTLIALVTQIEKADPAQFGLKKDEIKRKLLARKQREYYDAFLKQATEKAKIDLNPAVTSEQAG
jgi:hypothetical protein